VLREQGEVNARPVPRRAQRIGSPWPYSHVWLSSRWLRLLPEGQEQVGSAYQRSVAVFDLRLGPLSPMLGQFGLVGRPIARVACQVAV
jgi:hypothetical protein